MSGTAIPRITVILPIRNEAAFIERSLGAVMGQDYPPDQLEVLIVDGMSDDGTRELVQQMIAQRPSARMLNNPRLFMPSGVNVGLREATGELIALVGGHSVVSPDYLQRCVEALAETGAECVGGPMRAVSDSPIGEAVALATSHPFGVGGARFHYATQLQEVDTVYMGVWPRSVFDRVGLFDEEMVRDQDDEFSYRLRAAGGRIFVDPRIRSTYYARATLRSLWRQYFEYGMWKVRVFQKVPGSAQARHWVPPAFALGVIGGLLVALVVPVLRPICLAALVLYTLVNVGVSVVIAQRAGWRHLARLPLAFATLHLAYGLGFWAGVVRFGPPWRTASDSL